MRGYEEEKDQNEQRKDCKTTIGSTSILNFPSAKKFKDHANVMSLKAKLKYQAINVAFKLPIRKRIITCYCPQTGQQPLSLDNEYAICVSQF